MSKQWITSNSTATGNVAGVPNSCALSLSRRGVAHLFRTAMEKRRGETKKRRRKPMEPAPAATPNNNGDGAMILDVDLDPDTLECPVCFNPFLASIFQCKNGHAVCESCCARIGNTCPSCRDPIGDIRCRPLEKAIAGMAVPCAFAMHGCTRRLRYAEKQAHEDSFCDYAPCHCPVPGCAFSGTGAALYGHIGRLHANPHRSTPAAREEDDAVTGFRWFAHVKLHRSTPSRVLLYETDWRVFVLLNGGDTPSGRSLSLVGVGPCPAADRALEYMIEVAGDEPAGAWPLYSAGPVSFTRRCPAQPPAVGFLPVPDAYWSPASGSISVNVYVWRTPKSS
ncbi:hypothetical protein ACP4OV_021927 [Aristida adscensionis]